MRAAELRPDGIVPVDVRPCPCTVSLHMLRFHQILRLTSSFFTSPILSRQPNALLLKCNSRLPILSVLGRLFAFVLPILVLSSKFKATILEDVMNVIKITVIIDSPQNAQETSA